ncbi:MAG: methylmalonyl-CoA mutase [Nitrospinae bacterium RIFCSPLOWO2_02_39_17]|nr:MAG: methylmalonyl-CoA mutase [Nitrospinae bacterium RIFCSPLOWO2_02_39_17]
MKILLAKVGLDGHDRGVKVIRDALTNEGIEVIYTGLHKTPEEIVNTAINEKVDVIGISSMTGAHNLIFQRVFELLNERGKNIPVFAGGIIPDGDIPKLKEMGIKEVFLPGTELKGIVEFIKGLS